MNSISTAFEASTLTIMQLVAVMHDRMVVGFATTCAISAYHHLSCEFEPCSWRGVLDTICDQVCQVDGTPVSVFTKYVGPSVKTDKILLGPVK